MPAVARQRLGYHARRGVVCLDVVYKVIAGQGADVLSWPKNGPAQGAVLEGGGMKVVKDDLLSNSLNLQVQPDFALSFC